MVIRVERGKKTRRRRKKKNHIGFTNCLAILLLLFLVAGLVGGFLLAVLSIRHEFAGALACWTVLFTAIGTAVGIVIGKVVDKSKAENVGSQGEGIKFASAQANGFVQKDFEDSPAI